MTCHIKENIQIITVTLAGSLQNFRQPVAVAKKLLKVIRFITTRQPGQLSVKFAVNVVILTLTEKNQWTTSAQTVRMIIKLKYERM